MKTVTVFNTSSFVIVSLGNGIAYEFVNKPLDRTVFVQGDDAIQFSDELAAYLNTKTDEPIEARLADLWEDYAPVAR